MPHTHLVLVVDDDRDVRDLFADTLTEGGHYVEEANGGEDALRHLDEGLQPCVILADVRMPRMDGWELSRAVQERLPDVPVILVTGDKLLSIMAPVRTKPASPAELESMIRSYCPVERANAPAP